MNPAASQIAISHLQVLKNDVFVFLAIMCFFFFFFNLAKNKKKKKKKQTLEAS